MKGKLTSKIEFSKPSKNTFDGKQFNAAGYDEVGMAKSTFDIRKRWQVNKDLVSTSMVFDSFISWKEYNDKQNKDAK